jgi:hypothetical protein
MTADAGKTWSNSTMVLSTTMQPGTVPAETIAGKFFPEALGGKGAMVLITDGGCPGLHAYVSKTAGDMVHFVPATEECVATFPNNWANKQIAFFPDSTGAIASVGYTLWKTNPVKTARGTSKGMSMTLYNFKML